MKLGDNGELRKGSGGTNSVVGLDERVVDCDDMDFVVLNTVIERISTTQSLSLA